MTADTVTKRVKKIMDKYGDDKQVLDSKLYEVTCAVADAFFAQIISRQRARSCAVAMIKASKMDCGWGHFSSVISSPKVTELVRLVRGA